jgi:hypothetical protein
MTRVAWALGKVIRREQWGMEYSSAPRRVRANSRIMYLECKAGGLIGDARIGRVTFSRTRGTIYYGGQTFKSLKGAGFKSNYCCVETGQNYWISGPRRDGQDRLYGERLPVLIDADVRDEYWEKIRRQPERRAETIA